MNARPECSACIAEQLGGQLLSHPHTCGQSSLDLPGLMTNPDARDQAGEPTVSVRLTISAWEQVIDAIGAALQDSGDESWNSDVQDSAGAMMRAIGTEHYRTTSGNMLHADLP